MTEFRGLDGFQIKKAAVYDLKSKSGRKRELHYKRQKGGYWLCKEPMVLSEKLTYLSVTFDHIELASLRRGKINAHTGENMKAAHWICNMIRGNDPACHKISQDQKTAFISNMRKRARQEMGIPDDRYWQRRGSTKAHKKVENIVMDDLAQQMPDDNIIDEVFIHTALSVALLIRNLAEGLRVDSRITPQEVLFAVATAIEAGVVEMQQAKGTTH